MFLLGRLIERKLRVIEGEPSPIGVVNMLERRFKKIVKSRVSEAAFRYLNTLKEGHSKMDGLNYNKFEKAAYMSSPLFNSESVQLLLALH